MDANSEVLARLVACTPHFDTRPFTFVSFVDPATGKPPTLQVRRGLVIEVVRIVQRYPMLRHLLGGGDGISRLDAWVIAGHPALCALVAQQLGREKDTAFEAWVATWPEDDLLRFIGVWRSITMPEGVADFFGRVVRILAELGMPEFAANMILTKIAEIDAMLSALLTKLAASPPSTLSMKSLAGMLSEMTEEDPETTEETADDTPTTSPSPSPEVPSNSRTEVAEQIPG